MPVNYSYIAIDSRGRKTRGTIEAENRDEAISLLRLQGLHPTSLDSGMDSSITPESAGLQPLFDFFGFTFVSQKDMSVYTRKFASMINAGIIYTEIFDILADESENRRLRRTSSKIAGDLREGTNVHESMSKFPNVFPKVYRSMVKAGEHTGRLDHIMNQLADMYEQEHEFRSQVVSKLYFPIFYLIAGLLLIGIVITIVPRFFGPQANLFSPGLYWSVVRLYVFIALIFLFARTKPGYKLFRSIISYVPPFGGVLRKMSLAMFSRLFAAMYSSGVPVMTGLDIAGETLVEPDLARGIERVKREVHHGEDLATSLKKSNVFPRSLRGLVRTGEVAGAVDEMLNKAAEYYEIDIKTRSTMVATIMTILVMLIVLLTLATFIVSALANYFGSINELIDGGF